MTINWQDKAMAATRGTQLGAIIACAIGREIEGPRFWGKASITSDGYVMCNFTRADGENHMGAFVGSARDLVSNVRGLADHLSLAGQDRIELFKAVRDWVSLDYSRDALRGLDQ